VGKTAKPEGIVRFGVFEADLMADELRRRGLRVKLQERPFQVLALLLGRPGEVVTREELRQALWPPDTLVDLDNGINTAVNTLREALGDSAENPRFVKTFGRRGYRWLPEVTHSPEPERSNAQIVFNKPRWKTKKHQAARKTPLRRPTISQWFTKRFLTQ
jgi:DNA-binding winged helix-turn-helix (wHTH) protein